MGESINIDLPLREAINDIANEAAQKEGQKVREEHSARMRHYLEVLVPLGIVVTILAFLGVRTMINSAVEEAMEEYVGEEIIERANKISTDLKETNDEAGRLLQKIMEAADEVEKEKSLFQKRLAVKLADPGIETRRYRLSLPKKVGQYAYETGLKVADFQAAIVSSWDIMGKCLYKETQETEIFMNRSKETWQIVVDKSSSCRVLHVRIVYVPTEFVRKVHPDIVKLSPSK